MSCNVGAFIDCPNLQDTLNNQFNGLTGLHVMPSPLLEFVTSPQNTQNVIQRQVDTGNSKIRQVELTYESRICESQVLDTAVMSCEGGPKTCEDSKLYELDPTVGSSIAWSVEVNDLIGRCQDDETYFANQLMKYMNGLEQTINTKTWTQAALLFGKFQTSGAVTPIEGATKNAAGVYVGDLIEKIRYEYLMMEYQGAPVLFGSGAKYSQYWNIMNATCCNTTLGYDLGALLQTQQVLPFFDLKAGTALGDADEILAMAPGSLQLLTFNKFRGPRGISVMSSEIYKQGVIMSPRTGLSYDYVAKFDCGSWNFQLSLAHTLVTLPDDLFQSCDRLTGVTWVNNFKIVNPAIV